MFQGVRFDFDDKSMLRIAGAVSLATQALVFGNKLPKDEFWTDEAQPFAWIAADNSMVVMAPAQVLAFGQAAAKWEENHVFHARYLKDLPVIPVDYKDEKYWP
jgi:predicted NAD/FAD-dependent oxidoreductase